MCTYSYFPPPGKFSAGASGYMYQIVASPWHISSEFMSLNQLNIYIYSNYMFDFEVLRSTLIFFDVLVL